MTDDKPNHRRDVVGRAVHIAKIATGEIEDKPEDDGKDKAAQAARQKGRESKGF